MYLTGFGRHLLTYSAGGKIVGGSKLLGSLLRLASHKWFRSGLPMEVKAKFSERQNSECCLSVRSM